MVRSGGTEGDLCTRRCLIPQSREVTFMHGGLVSEVGRLRRCAGVDLDLRGCRRLRSALPPRLPRFTYSSHLLEFDSASTIQRS